MEPYWMQRQKLKLGATVSQQQQTKDRKEALTVWFTMQATMAPGKCENCGRSLAATIAFHPRAHIAHIVPKSPTNGCPSVATHPLNRWFGCKDCHDAYDNESTDVVETMPVIVQCRERLSHFIKEIPDTEIRRVPVFLLPPAIAERPPGSKPEKAETKKVPKPKKKTVKSLKSGKKQSAGKNKAVRGPGGKFVRKSTGEGTGSATKESTNKDGTD